MKKTLALCAALMLTSVGVACRPTPRPGTTTTTTASPGPTTTLTPGPADCDRGCLKGALDQYLAALLAHDPSRLPLAANVKFTEDNVVKPVGEGFWRTATRARGYRQDVLDVRAGVAGMHAVLEEGTRPVLFLVRLRLAQGQITEIETVVVRNAAEGNSIFAPDRLQAPTPAMTLTPPAAQRDSRAELTRIGDLYAAGLKAGSFVQTDVPFANGVGCSASSVNRPLEKVRGDRSKAPLAAVQ